MAWWNYVPFGEQAHGLYEAAGLASAAIDGERPVTTEDDSWWGSTAQHHDRSGELAGASLHLGPDTITDEQDDYDKKLDLWNFDANIGTYNDAAGESNWGLSTAVAGMKYSQMENIDAGDGPEFVHGYEVGVNEGALQATAGESGAALGVQANIVSGAATFGTAGTEIDESYRVGGSLGAGAAGRLHWSDADGDGNTEYGLGADLGPVSFDVKSEDPLYTMLNVGTLGMWEGGGSVIDYVAGNDLDGEERTNYTHAVGGAIDSGVEAAGDVYDYLFG